MTLHSLKNVRKQYKENILDEFVSQNLILASGHGKNKKLT